MYSLRRTGSTRELFEYEVVLLRVNTSLTVLTDTNRRDAAQHAAYQGLCLSARTSQGWRVVVVVVAESSNAFSGYLRMPCNCHIHVWLCSLMNRRSFSSPFYIEWNRNSGRTSVVQGFVRECTGTLQINYISSSSSWPSPPPSSFNFFFLFLHCLVFPHFP